jgi:arabinogalactan oligomer/maltooligosaccharide transport system permease protein
MSKRTKAMLLSIFLWGGGQFLICRQRLKGAIIFAIQVLFIGIELQSGYWIEYFCGLIPKFKLRLYGGFFTRGIWGLITLGTKPGARTGDHSTMLLISGIIILFVLLLFVYIYIWNIRDAYLSGKKLDETGDYESSKEYMKAAYTKSFPFIILSPIMVLILFVVIMPIIFSVLTAFTNYNKNHLPPASLVDWVGFQNFVKLLKVPIWTNTFLHVFLWTVLWAVFATLTTYFMGLIQAVLLNSKYVRFKSLYRSIMILPWAIPQLVSLLVFKNLLNGQFGPLGQFLMDMGLTDQRIPFLTNPTFAKISVILVNLWLGFPMFMIMIQGMLSNIDKGLYEAAEIDGAGSYQVFRKITLPLVFKATGPLLIMNFAGNFNGFGSIYFLTEGGPVNANYQLAGDTDILLSWIYKLTLNNQIYDMAAVMCIILFLIIAGFSFWNFRRTNAFKEV